MLDEEFDFTANLTPEVKHYLLQTKLKQLKFEMLDKINPQHQRPDRVHQLKMNIDQITRVVLGHVSSSWVCGNEEWI